ncbi:MAG: HigA family addiction module antidote protein [Bacteroidales bacterium]|nr:HigA family addiction module antidote protein [Bacteroidales bacterium]
METKAYIPFEATHPGFVLKEELQARGIKQKEFALDIDMQPTMLNELIKEKRAVTAEIALSLEKALGIPADFWMRFQAGYELDCARIKERNIRKTQQIEIWSIIKQFVPVSIFAKLGLLSNSLADNIARIWDIYDVDSIDLLVERVSVNKNMAYYKKSEKLKNDQINILGWSQLARWQAKPQKVNVFNPESREVIIAELKTLFRTNKNVISSTQEILNKYGIKFIVLERFKQSPIDGYSFWSNENPTIVVTMRKKLLDNFAFTVMHELGHVFTHLIADKNGDFLDIEYPNSSVSDKEQEAHRFAQQCFIQETIWNEFYSRNQKFNYSSTEHEMVQLANKEKIHPSIIFGRYCFETGNFAIRTSIDRTIN